MKLEASVESAEKIAADWLIVGVWEGTEANPKLAQISPLLAERVQKWKEAGDFDGKANEVLPILDPLGTASHRILLLGLGKKDAVTSMSIARAAGTALRSIARKKYNSIVISPLAHDASLDAKTATTATVVGLLMAEGGQDLHRAKRNRKPPESIILAGNPSADALREGQITGDAVRGVADLVNLTPAELYPESFCERAQAAAQGLPITLAIMDAETLAKEKMECILGVGKGSTREPRLLDLRYDGAPGNPNVIALVGKGITFDSGGLSIKTADGMTTMKCDMAGAATVLHTTLAAAKLKLPVNIRAFCPLAENMLGGNAVKPGDVLRARNGKTIEVLNTDAEGRLVLADALSYAVEQKVTHIIDLATLTGACMVALGTNVAGVMTNNEPWSQLLLNVARVTGERAWPLPMFEEYDELIKSGVADMKNIGGRWGGTITAAKLLANFVADVPWVHVDIAGPAFNDKECSYQDAGGTGFFVRTLLNLLRQYPEGAATNA